MSHDHSATGGSYYMDQLCAIATAGALGGVCIGLWVQGELSYILAQRFHIFVLVGGIVLVLLAVVRGIALWKESAALPEHHHHDHDHHHHHDTGHDCGTDCGHDHGHEGWTPARYAVLLLPVLLFFFNLPNASFSAEWADKLMNKGALEEGKDVQSKAGLVLGFRELTNAAYMPQTREYFEGKTGRLKGMFKPLGNDKEFTLLRVRMNCCAADAVVLQMRIISPQSITQMKANDWVEVEGQIQFRKLVGAEKYMPVLVLESADKVKPTAAILTDDDL